MFNKPLKKKGPDSFMFDSKLKKSFARLINKVFSHPVMALPRANLQ